ncbi:hypothetical protein BHE74_00013055 [Ensete ventricosum]|nr:hypothetical protein BHE74_00013055 [Ensete ventricosum]RZS18295.1 hypothetical protein BHM03_00050534 [Ensete ventricosum]
MNREMSGDWKVPTRFFHPQHEVSGRCLIRLSLAYVDSVDRVAVPKRSIFGAKDELGHRKEKRGGERERERGDDQGETMELEILGINFGCVIGALRAWEFPEKDCLLPLVAKILGYCIVAASTTVKVPQVWLRMRLRFPYPDLRFI